MVFDDDHIGTAVTVDIGDHVPFEAMGLVTRDEAAVEVSFSVVHEPVEAIVAVGVGRRQIDVAVAIDVGRAESVVVSESVPDEVFRELHFSGGRLAGRVTYKPAVVNSADAQSRQDTRCRHIEDNRICSSYGALLRRRDVREIAQAAYEK